MILNLNYMRENAKTSLSSYKKLWFLTTNFLGSARKKIITCRLGCQRTNYIFKGKSATTINNEPGIYRILTNGIKSELYARKPQDIDFSVRNDNFWRPRVFLAALENIKRKIKFTCRFDCQWTDHNCTFSKRKLHKQAMANLGIHGNGNLMNDIKSESFARKRRDFDFPIQTMVLASTEFSA